MQSAYQAKGLDHWISKLEHAVLPVPPPSAAEIKRLLVDPNTSLNQIGNLVAKDPVLRLLVIRACNERYADQAAGSLINPHHCISMMGLDQISALVDSLTILDTKNNRFSAHYLQAIILSQHAADQAVSWAPFRHQGNLDQLILACLLYGVANWALWQVASDEARMIESLVFQYGVATEKAELAVLGCQQPELAQMLARCWCFPAPVCDSIYGAPIPSTKFLMRYARQARRYAEEAVSIRMPNRTDKGVLAHSQAFTVSLSNYLARQVTQGWYLKRTLRCQAIIAAYLDLPLIRTLESTKSVALGSSQRFSWAPVQSPAEGLLWPLRPPARQRLKPSQLGAAVQKMFDQLQSSKKSADAMPVPSPAAAQAPPHALQKPRAIGLRSEQLPDELDHDAIRAAPKPAPRPVEEFPGFRSAEKQQLFNSLLHELQQKPSGFENQEQALRSVVDRLHECTELERVVVALVNPARNAVEAYYSQGCADTPGLQKFRVKLQPPNLFTQLLKQQAATWISRDSQLKPGGMIPGELRQASMTEYFFLMSIFNKQGPYAVFYADRGINDRIGLSEAQYKIFKTACSQFSRYLLSVEP